MSEDDYTEEYVSTLPMPPGAVVQNSVLAVSYFDPEGETRYGFATKGDAPLTSVLGLLEIVKAHLLGEQG